MWKVNAGRRSRYARTFLDGNLVAIGWHVVGDPTSFTSKAALLAAVGVAYPDRSERQHEVAASQIWRFMHEVSEGDEVITYDPETRHYHYGKIAGSVAYNPDRSDELPTERAVKWLGTAERDLLTVRTKARLGAVLTLFMVEPKAADEVRALANGGNPRPTVPENDGDISEVIEEAEDPFAALEDQALERVKDRILALDWEEMQELVAALLRSLGYRTIISPSGPDRGKDIVASRDGFGFEPPRIVVEVKHRKGAMGAPEIRAFLGGRHAQDKGLYVSTGGFSREAHFEAERASTVTHLMTLDGLARALIANYEAVDERGKSLLPLVRVYWPA